LKHSVAEFLENHWVETVVVALVLVDVALVTLEAGLDSQLLCIGGKVVPSGSPAGEHLQVVGHGHEHSLLSLGLTGGSTLAAAASRMFGELARAGAAGWPLLPALLMRGAGGPAEAAASAERADTAAGGAPERAELLAAGARRGATRRTMSSGGSLVTESIDPQKVHDEHRRSAGGHGEKMPDVMVCEGPEGHTVHHMAHTCHFWSIVILCIFSVELVVKLWAIPGFWHHFLHKMDIVVVFSSLFIDTVVIWYIEQESSVRKRKAHKSEVDVVTGLMMLARVWRVVRIVHGLYEYQLEQVARALQSKEKSMEREGETA